MMRSRNLDRYQCQEKLGKKCYGKKSAVKTRRVNRNIYYATTKYAFELPKVKGMLRGRVHNINPYFPYSEKVVL